VTDLMLMKPVVVLWMLGFVAVQAIFLLLFLAIVQPRSPGPIRPKESEDAPVEPESGGKAYLRGFVSRFGVFGGGV
jgi:hypothetical protein